MVYTYCIGLDLTVSFDLKSPGLGFGETEQIVHDKIARAVDEKSHVRINKILLFCQCGLGTSGH